MADKFKLFGKNGAIWRMTGRVAYLVVWPGLWLVITLTPKRSRVLVVAEGELLLSLDWLGPGKWSLPGGGLHRNEDERVGAVREVEEEVGVSLNVRQLEKLGDLTAVNNGITSNLVVFLVKLDKKPKVSISSLEILDYFWVNNESINKLKIDKSTREILKSFPEVANLLQ